jgi:hypothetical protein
MLVPYCGIPSSRTEMEGLWQNVGCQVLLSRVRQATAVVVAGFADGSVADLRCHYWTLQAIYWMHWARLNGLRCLLGVILSKQNIL